MKSKHNVITNKNLIIVLLLMITLVLAGCGDNTDHEANTDTTATTRIVENTTGDVSVKISVPEPNQIIVGTDGKSVTLSKSSDDYVEITNIINSRFSKSTISEIDAGYTRVYENGNIVLKNADFIRKNETYVEYIYDTAQSTSFESLSPTSSTEFTRILFPITGSANSNFIVASEESYSEKSDTTHHYATLIANTDIIVKIQSLTETSQSE